MYVQPFSEIMKYKGKTIPWSRWCLFEVSTGLHRAHVETNQSRVAHVNKQLRGVLAVTIPRDLKMEEWSSTGMAFNASK